MWQVGAAHAAASNQQTISFEAAICRQRGPLALLRRLGIRHVNKLLAVASYGVAFHHASVTSAVLLAATLICISGLSTPSWRQRRALQSAAAISAGAFAAVWMLTLYAVSWQPVAMHVPDSMAATLRLVGVAPLQVRLLASNT